jgi:hypothetical protein
MIGRPPAEPLEPAAHVFVDLSNLWYGARHAAVQHDESPSEIRLMARPLLQILSGGRPVRTAWIVANDDVPEAVTSHFAQIGTVIRRESGKRTGSEQANDETLQVRIYETLFAFPPAVLVLGTGDGAGWRQRRGFLAALDSACRLGWAVETVAWNEITNKRLAEWSRLAGGAYVDLDNFYYSLTFIEGGRTVQPVLLHHRATARHDPSAQSPLPRSRLDMGLLEADRFVAVEPVKLPTE